MQWTSVCLVRSNAAALALGGTPGGSNGGRAGAFADDFLDHLVRRCPDLARVLTWNREMRRRELADTFAAILRYAANTQALAARLTVIAASNERRGVRRPHYEHGREVLLTLLREYNGPAWSPELARAWEELLDHAVMHLAPPQCFEEAMAA
jgi:hemoglobin-like flavoprotein